MHIASDSDTIVTEGDKYEFVNEFFLADATLCASHTNYENMVKQIRGHVNMYGPVRRVLSCFRKRRDLPLRVCPATKLEQGSRKGERNDWQNLQA